MENTQATDSKMSVKDYVYNVSAAVSNAILVMLVSDYYSNPLQTLFTGINFIKLAQLLKFYYQLDLGQP